MASNPTHDKGETITTVTATTQIDLPLHPHKPTYEEMNPKSRAVEFMGPLGVTALTVLTPLFAYLLYAGCNERVGCPPKFSTFDENTGRHGLFFDVHPSDVTEMVARALDWKAHLIYAVWYAYIVACWKYLPGEWVEGTVLRNGKKQVYKINAFATLLLTTGLIGGLLINPTTSSKGQELMSWMYDRWLGLLTAAFVNSVVQALAVYWQSFNNGELLALGGNSGNFIYDFWMGRPLNPTPASAPDFDIKSFNELRPGMILWWVLDLSCLCEQSIRLGGLHKVTASMWLVLLMHGVYIFDALYNETSVLTTMDITTDGFGFMLSFGDLVWVPFTYSLQARYLAFHPTFLGQNGTLAILALEAVGYYIFRVSNKEKNDFKNGKDKKNLSFMKTKKGNLITSGWWGRSRHPNYMGDWIMAWAWCLPTGFSTPITYFYVVYFAILLVHRQRRDDHACTEKYGADWKEYCKRVPSRIIPGIY
ncbi:erg24, C-14 sterol reductase [Naganishia albida]|nr:erg24, C-14 sterol reductase [Naganishia albida]